MLNQFSLTEIGAIFRNSTFPIMLGMAFLLIALAGFFEYRRKNNPAIPLLVAATSILLLKAILMLLVNRHIVWDAGLNWERIPWTAWNNAILEAVTTLAVMYVLFLLIHRKASGRRYLIFNGGILAGIIALGFLAGSDLVTATWIGNQQHWIVMGTHLFNMWMLEQLVRKSNELSDYTDPDDPHLVTSIGVLQMFCRTSLFANGVFIFAGSSPTVVYLGQATQAVAYFFFMLFSGHLSSISYWESRDRVNAVTRESQIMVELFELINNTITKAKGVDEVLKLITESAARTTTAAGAAMWLYRENKQAFENVSIAGVYPPLRPAKNISVYRHDTINQKTSQEKFGYGKTYAGVVAETREPIHVNDLLDKPHPLVEQTTKDAFDIKSLICVPILDEENKAIGVIGVVNKDDLYSRFTPSDLSLCQVLGKQTILAIRHFELIQESIAKKVSDRDVSIASQIQQNLLPTEYIEQENYEFHGFSVAAKGVGGDYFDIMNLEPGRFGVIMSDVAGKGIPASLVMVMISTVFRTMAASTSSTKVMAERVNEALCNSSTMDRYATFYYFIVDMNKGEMVYSNAAHGPLLVYHAKRDEFELYDTGGVPVGIARDAAYEEKTAKIDKGDILVLYTDGITEAMNLKRDQYSIERLKEQVKLHMDKPANEMTKVIYADVKEFCGTAPQHDDETLLILKLR
ncbi:MAG: SpoIIE family protein phosphatase [Spirochaetes bacterium]|nr:SpoIIE family protein phosphatase [Spirochaetota bacterium]